MKPLLKVQNIKKYFPIGHTLLRRSLGEIRAVDDVSFTISEGETLGILGESGCGKSTIGQLALRLLEPTDGEVHFRGISVFQASPGQLRELRREMQIIFQDPYSSMNPRLRIEETVAEGMEIHGLAKGESKKELVAELLRNVGMSPDHMRRFPHELSGGQRQRICIARALAVNPKFIVADEPTAALDISIQAQIINLLMNVQKEHGLAYLFISHDLRVIRNVSDRVAVIYLGRIVELADTSRLFANPLHPYTSALLSAIPSLTPTRRSRIILSGEPPSPLNPPIGCPFHPRCPKRIDTCTDVIPQWKEVEPGHWVACHLN